MSRRIKPPKHLAHCAEADGLMAIDSECAKERLAKLRERIPLKPPPADERREPQAAREPRRGQTVLPIPKKSGPQMAEDMTLSPATVVTGAIGLTRSALNLRVLPDDKIEERRKICEECPHLKLLKPKMVGLSLPLSYMGCELCGCRYKSKIRLAGESCPVGKWGPVPLDPESN